MGRLRVLLFGLAALMLLPVAGQAGPAGSLNVLLLPWGGINFELETAVVKRFQEEYPDIDVNVTMAKNHAAEELLVAVAGGAPPDVAIVIYDWMISEGVLQPLDQYLRTSPAVAELKKRGGAGTSVFEFGVAQHTVGGRAYMLPTLWFYPVYGLIMNATMFREAGLEPFSPARAPKWDEVQSAHRKLVRYTADGKLERIGFPIGSFDAPGVVSELFGVDIVDTRANRPALKNLAGTMGYLYDAFVQGVNQEAGFLGMEAGASLMAQRRAAMTLQGSHAVDSIVQGGGLDPNELASTWVPQAQGKRLHFMGGWKWGLVTGAKNLANAHRFLDFTITDLEWHRRSFEATGQMGAPAYTNVPEWTRGMSQAKRWFYESTGSTDRFVPPLGVSWGSMLTNQWRQEGRVYERWVKGEAPPAQLVEQADRVIAAKIAEGQGK